MITVVFQKTLQDTLNSKYLSSDDFDISFGKSNGGAPKINISYKFKKEYNFAFVIVSDKFYLTITPGEIVTEETFTRTNKEQLIQDLENWVNSIESEMAASPGLKKILENKAEVDNRIDEIEESLKILGDEHFTKLEAEELKARVEKLEETFSEKLEEEIQDKVKLDKELIQFKKEVAFLKLQVENLSKANWLKAFVSKTFIWGKRNPNTVKAISSMAIDLLPDAMKSSIPSELMDLIASSEQEAIKEERIEQ